MDFDLTEDESAVADLAQILADREIHPQAQKAWEDARCPVAVLQALGSAGLLGLLVPAEWGGAGVSTVGFVAAMDRLGRADQSIASAWQAHSTIGSLPILLFGTDAQRERWLRPLAEGRALGAFGLTEPGAGSDTQSITTKAARVDGGWVLNGTKTFCSNAGTDMSYGVVVLARTGERPDGSPA